MAGVVHLEQAWHRVVTCAHVPTGSGHEAVTADAASGPGMVHRQKAPGSISQVRRCYLRALNWAFTLFSSARIVAYLPTLWAIYQSGDASQHSLVTWLAWLGGNVTMAAWLRENNGGVVDRAVAVNLVNAAMCLAAVLLISWYRF